MKPLKVHLLPEYGIDCKPHGTSYLRLIRPLGHPSIHERVEMSYSIDYHDQKADIVVADRLVLPAQVDSSFVDRLAEKVHRQKARFYYAFDDDFSILPYTKSYTPEHRSSFERLIRLADGLIVTTAHLKNVYSDRHRNITIIPNALDERLLVPGPFEQADRSGGRIVIGYMGTHTHQGDLDLILPALEAVSRRYPGKVEFQLVGVTSDTEQLNKLGHLSFLRLNPSRGENEYPLFMLWFTGNIKWDLAIAPLADTPFNRSKSYIKYLDYAAVGVPGIYSRIGVYDEAVSSGETGWLVDNTAQAWEDALMQCVEDRQQRLLAGRNAYLDLYQNHILAHRAKDWLDAFEKLGS